MDKRKDRKADDFDPLHSIAVASGAGLTILCSIGIGLWLGMKCDEYLGTHPLASSFSPFWEPYPACIR